MLTPCQLGMYQKCFVSHSVRQRAVRGYVVMQLMSAVDQATCAKLGRSELLALSLTNAAHMRDEERVGSSACFTCIRLSSTR
jgi:hypothetical protein